LQLGKTQPRHWVLNAIVTGAELRGLEDPVGSETECVPNANVPAAERRGLEDSLGSEIDYCRIGSVSWCR
jgi:hypothetical protein